MIAALTLAAAVLATGSMAPRLGEEIEVVIPARAHGLTYFPDAHITLLQREPDVRMLLVARTSTHLLTGPDMLSLSPIAQVLTPGEPGAFDNVYAGIFGVFRSPRSDALLALYHAEDQEQMPKLENGVPGYFASIRMAVSDDGIHYGDPVQLLACIPLPRQGDELSWHPSFVIDSVSSDGLSGYLYYAFSESWGWADPDKPHYLVRRPLTVSLP